MPTPSASDSASPAPDGDKGRGSDPYAPMRVPDYARFLIGGVCSATGAQMLSMAVTWELYKRTHSKLVLANVGLALVIPIFLFSILAGHVADRLDRRWVCAGALAVRGLSSLAMVWISYTQGPVEWVYACLFINGAMRAFLAPARTALLPEILPVEHFEHAVRWNTGGFQLASVCGPALGGVVIKLGGAAWPVYLLDMLCAIINTACLLSIRKPKREKAVEPISVKTLLLGINFVWNSKLILAAITLDLFAVLFGGVQALLPVFAEDILHVDADGLGWLRAAESVGALGMALILAHRAPSRRSGVVLFWAVAGYGASIVVFGFSHSFWLSFLALALCGAFDNISVVIRHTLIQLRTPNQMRGRVAAVNMVFISSSNELGMVESGVVAHFFGAQFSAISGGVGTILVVLLSALRWPELLKLGPLQEEPGEL